MKRRHDIDALRALAFALVILYHVGMYYVAGWHWHLKSPHAAEWLQLPMRAMNLWRMDLVFVVSGVALGFLAHGQGAGSLLKQRSLRLVLPLAFGMLVVVPYQPYAQAVANGAVVPGFGAFLLRYFTLGPWPRDAFDGADPGVTWNHLWYLPYLWLYTAVVVALLPVLRTAPARRLQQAFAGLRGSALLLLPVLPLTLSSVLLRPHFPPTHDLLHDAWLHASYFTVFFYGWWIGTHPGWWAEAARLRWWALGMAAAVFALLLAAPVPRQAVRVVADFYVWGALLAILGFAHRHLNRPWPWLAWANESVYPWYMLHQTLIIVLAVGLAPLALGPVAEPIVLVAGTVAGCWGLTALVRRSNLLRPLFGLRPRAPSRYRPQAPTAGPAARSA
jgi:glucans biosynthesis protein C